MHFEVIGQIEQIETFATGSGIRELARLRKVLGAVAGASATA
jgi:hypothetical protein